MNIKCIIVDDEPLAIEVIKNYINKFELLNLVESFSNAIDALNFIQNNKIDVIFLDINMPLLDGLSFIKSLEIKPLIVITSAHTEYAVDTYELDVLDYLVKPIEFPRFTKAINKIFRETSTNNEVDNEIKERPSIFVKINKKKLQKIYLDEILVIESLKDYLKINTTKGRYIIHNTLSNFTEQLPGNFLRIHRSYTISIDKVDLVEGNSVEIDGIRYTIGRTYIEEVKHKILNN